MKKKHFVKPTIQVVEFNGVMLSGSKAEVNDRQDYLVNEQNPFEDDPDEP